MSDEASDLTTPEWSIPTTELNAETVEDYVQHIQVRSAALALAEADPRHPFDLMYQARDGLLHAASVLQDLLPPQGDFEPDVIVPKRAVLLGRAGVLYLDVDEPGLGVPILEEAVELLEPFKGLPANLTDYITFHQRLAATWGDRSEFERGRNHIAKARELYEEAYPPEEQDKTEFDVNYNPTPLGKAHTLSLYCQAQLERRAENGKISADLLRRTLVRQSKEEGDKLDNLEWSANVMSLAQYYLESDLTVYEWCLTQAETALTDLDVPPEKRDDFVALKANVALCWGRMALVQLEKLRLSVARRGGETMNPDLEEAERFVTPEDKEEAREYFVAVTTWDTAALKFYVFDGFVTEHLNLLIDLAKAHELYAFFESDLSIKCKLHRRRVTQLETKVRLLNPQHYGEFIRSIEFELAQTYNLMYIYKQRQDEQNMTVERIRKHHKLAKSAIAHYQLFVNSVLNPKDVRHDTSDSETPFDREYMEPLITAMLQIAKIYLEMKGSRDMVITHNEKALETFQNAARFIGQFAGDTHTQELHYASEMAKMLPMRIAGIKAGLLEP